MIAAVTGSFTLKVFFFGLIGFVPDAQGTNVVLPLVPGDHFPYLSYREDACVQSCGHVKVFGTNLPGYELTGYKIQLSPMLPGRVKPAGEGLPDPTDHVPKNQTEAAYLYWVPAMSRVLKLDHNDGTIQDDCVTGDPPSACRLAGRLRLTSGTLSTCRLTELGGLGSNTEIFSYDFKRYRGGNEISASQAIAAITVYETTIPSDSLKVDLIRFGEETPLPVVLKPRDCGGGNLCLSLYVANPEKMQFNNESTEIGTHFGSAYRLLKTAIVDPDKHFLPERDHNTHKPAKGLQPTCSGNVSQAILSSAAAGAADAGSRRFRSEMKQAEEDALEKEIANFLVAPGKYPPPDPDFSGQSRPICPMTSYQ